MQRKITAFSLLALLLAATVLFLLDRTHRPRERARNVASEAQAPAQTPILPPAARAITQDTSLRARTEEPPRAHKPAALLEDASAREEIVRRGERVRSLVGTGRKFEMAGSSYRIFSQLRALPEAKYVPSDGSLIESRAGHVFFEVPSGVEPRSDSRPVVYDEKSGTLGVVTGALSVKWSSAAANVAIAKEYGLQTLQSFDGISTTFYQSSRSQPSELLELLSRLQSDKRVISVSLHIIEHAATAQ